MQLSRLLIVALVFLVLVVTFCSAQTDDNSTTTSGGRKGRKEQKQQQQQQGVDGDDDNDGNDDSDNSRGRRRGGRRRNKAVKEDINVSWKQSVGDGRVVTLSLQAPANKEIIVVESKDKDLGDLGFVASTTTYDYTTDSALVAINPKGRGPCYLTGESLTYQQIMDNAVTLGASVAPHSVENATLVDGTGAALSRDKEDEIFSTNPEIKRACGRGNIVMLEESGDPPKFSGETKEVKVIIYDAELTIVVPAGRKG
ncbi:hypothetical protein PoB_007618300 [Plakobranchus ocellatus]|uniref:Uncharacterized protein n=1 Tax=Plakobranchus ocellatus TaxID=259542 RepID=A0AAV4DZ93_9GAST|nr:hypothetical protein PoB_007618300 [Plakobranchus ocellatus]